MRILVPFGTRPEVIKLASAVQALRDHGHTVRALATGQHDDARLADAFFTDLDLAPDVRWELPKPESARVGAILEHAYTELTERRPDAVMLLGDTHTVPLFALAARRFQVPVIHLEAGLRSFNPRSLEESHRRTAAALASLHLVPTPLAASFLAAEGIDEARVRVVGNPITDALARFAPKSTPPASRRGIVFTAHRATNVDHPERLDQIVRIVTRLADEIAPVRFPVHPRTEQRLRADGRWAELADHPGVELVGPLRYSSMLEAIATARLVVTDSGGVQEEASWFGVPLVVLRATTPRWEGVVTGSTELVGLRPDLALSAATRLTDPAEQARIAAIPCPYGDGQVGERVAALVSDPATMDLLRLDEPDLTADLPRAVSQAMTS